jgi:hypothetical protein
VLDLITRSILHAEVLIRTCHVSVVFCRQKLIVFHQLVKICEGAGVNSLRETAIERCHDVGRAPGAVGGHEFVRHLHPVLRLSLDDDAGICGLEALDQFRQHLFSGIAGRFRVKL